VVPADRFAAAESDGLELWFPPSLEVAPPVDAEPRVEARMPVGMGPQLVRVPGSGAAIELDKPVPPSGNMTLVGRQFWLGPARAGQVVRFWVDCEVAAPVDWWAAGEVVAVAVQRQ